MPLGTQKAEAGVVIVVSFQVLSLLKLSKSHLDSSLKSMEEQSKEQLSDIWF